MTRRDANTGGWDASSCSRRARSSNPMRDESRIESVLDAAKLRVGRKSDL